MKKNNITLKNGSFFLNDKPFFIYSGEIHYFRTPYKMWRKYLKRAKQAGLNTVSTYIPWRWHEYRQGKFDFTGKTKKERNLLAFLDMVKDENLYLILRPGPICHGEITDGGIPAWLIDKHPEVLQKKPDGSYADRMRISFHNSTYLRFVEKWYKKIMPIIAKRQVTRGSNVILVQLDNEISMINWLFREIDYSRKTQRLYHQFLRERYISIKELNERYNSKFKDFSQVKLALPSYDKQPGFRYWDWAAFWRKYYSDYYQLLSKMAKSLGIEVPFIANIAQFADFDVYGRGLSSPMTAAMFSEFSKKVKNLVMGGAYQMRRLDYGNFHDVAVTTEVIKMISDDNSPAVCVELQTGILVDRPTLYPSDVDLNIFTSTAHGLNGLNAYMFTSGKNFPDMGIMGTYHKWQAPVAIDGKTRPHFKPLKRWGRIFKTFGKDLASSKKEFDVTVGYYMPYYATDYLKGEFGRKLEYKRNKFFFDGICRLLELAGYNFNIVDIQSEDLDDIKLLVVCSLEFMDRETQKKLAQYVKRGGNLIIGPRMPSTDLAADNYYYLQNKFNLKSINTQDKFITDGKNLFLSEGTVTAFKSDDGATLFKTESRKKAAILKHIGKGNLIAYGFGLTHTFNYHIDIMELFLKKMNIKSLVKKYDREIQTVVRKNEDSYFLFVANYHELEKKVSLSISPISGLKNIKIPHEGFFILPERSCRILPINYKITDEFKIIKTTIQILNISKNKNKIIIEAEVTPSAEEEIVFDAKGVSSIRVNGKKITPAKKEYYIVSFTHESSLCKIEIS